MYSTELTLNSPIWIVRKFLMDPLFISGVSGHISILKFKDKQNNEYLMGDRIRELSTPTDEFIALYILLRTSKDFKYTEGIFKGPEVKMQSIKYSGMSDDGKLEFTIEFMPKSLGDTQTRLYVATNVKYNDSLLDKMLGKSAVDFAKHIVEDHFVTYARVYFPSLYGDIIKIFNTKGKPTQGLSVAPSLEFTGDAGSILSKINEMISQLDLGLIKVNFDKLSCNIVVQNTEMKRAICRSDSNVKTGFEALSMIISAKGQGKIEVYSVKIEDLMETLYALA
ncbi:hypothetical protein J5U23_01470 [Saccharolobus shibatae B12]|uniref:Uncharacterized protein n=1 Tax=Saccharolobus shibatae (strain ATCC 51178 / DSM 5389 / JCM 8931 / NBRC 15437 / B12) TaxID=523848 RepID=A0A8F5BNV8_SACSH|nr:hypothetical protein [Saccharolobus shibatae]QXJ28601.1 hypothetical protein J5U23_01470 [Saccharolobus shibatae B12]